MYTLVNILSSYFNLNVFIRVFVFLNIRVCTSILAYRCICPTSEMQTTLLSTYPPTLIATILRALREQRKESDQVHSVEEIAGPVPDIPLEYDQILKEGGKFWDDVNGGYLPDDLVLATRREEIVEWCSSAGWEGATPHFIAHTLY